MAEVLEVGSGLAKVADVVLSPATKDEKWYIRHRAEARCGIFTAGRGTMW
jgi:hypothetical protein